MLHTKGLLPAKDERILNTKNVGITLNICENTFALFAKIFRRDDEKIIFSCLQRGYATLPKARNMTIERRSNFGENKEQSQITDYTKLSRSV